MSINKKMEHHFKVALVGRTNVGKSTLYNRFNSSCKKNEKKAAITSSEAGLTRNVKETLVNWMGLEFIIMDMPGLFDSSSNLSLKTHQISLNAINEADLILFIIDFKEGITPFDVEIANILRKKNKNIIIIENKAEKSEVNSISQELGLPFESIQISAKHGLGIQELVISLDKYIKNKETINENEKGIKVAIMGRPNVGKSTLFNKLLNEEKSLVDDAVGVTRDSITHKLVHNNKNIDLIDTAGLLKKTKTEVDFLCKEDALLTLKYSEVVIFVVNDQTADQIITVQDLDLIKMIINEGRVVILAVNMYKNIDSKKIAELENIIKHKAVKGLSWCLISAKTGYNVSKLMDMVLESYEIWNKRIPTNKLNNWLEVQTKRHEPPMHQGRRIKFKYMTQIKTRPPTFVIFSTKSDKVPNDYMKFLENNLREDFELKGIPLRIKTKSPKNPYADKA